MRIRNFIPKMLLTVTACLTLLISARAATAAEQTIIPSQCIDADIILQAKQLKYFRHNGQTSTNSTGEAARSANSGEPIVCTLDGDAKIHVGSRTLSADKALIWVYQKNFSGRIYRRVEIYLEGNVTVIEPEATSTKGNSLLITVMQTGEFIADADEVSQFDTMPLNLYKQPRRPSDDKKKSDAPQPRQPVRYRADSINATIPATDKNATDQTPQKPLLICKGNIVLSYGGVDSVPPVDIQADAAVLYFPADSSKAADGETVAHTATQKNAASKSSPTAQISAAYLEGDVRMTSADRTIRADKLYIDFENERAIIVDAVFHAVRQDRNLPIYIRAEHVRLTTTRDSYGQLISRNITSGPAQISTSEFYSPTYHIAVSAANLSDRTPRNEAGEATADTIDTELTLRAPVLKFYDIPLFYWPKAEGSTGEMAIPLRSLKETRDKDLGHGIKTTWDLSSMLGLKDPDGFNTEWQLDGYQLGFGTGIDMEYRRDNYYGYLEGSYLSDHNNEMDVLYDEEIYVPTDRYYLLWRHKQFIGDGWQLQSELSAQRGDLLYKLDRDSYWTDKKLENSLYLRKQQDNWSISILGQADWLDHSSNSLEDEYYLNRYDVLEILPEVRADLTGQSIFSDTATLYASAQGGMYRRRHPGEIQSDSHDFQPAGSGRLEMQLPIKLGPVNIVAAAGGEAFGSDYYCFADMPPISGYFDHFGSIRANTSLSRIWPQAESRLLDINGLRHIVTPEAIVYYSGLTTQNDNFFLEDTTNSTRYGSSLRLRQRWQTHRGPAGNQHISELASLNVAFDCFSDNYGNDVLDTAFNYSSDHIGRFFFDRPENSRMHNNINADTSFNFSDSTALLGDGIYDTTNRKITLANAGLAVQRDPRLKYYLGTRYMDLDRSSYDDSLVGTAGFTYNITRKYELSVFQQYDFLFNDGEALSSRVTLIRKFPRWLLGVTFHTDKADDLTALEITLWPQGMPNLHLGNGPKMSTWASEGMGY